MAENLRARSPEEVFQDHLRLAGQHRFEEDISATSRLTAPSWNAAASSVDATGCANWPGC
jgi:hypothetical protein